MNMLEGMLQMGKALSGQLYRDFVGKCWEARGLLEKLRAKYPGSDWVEGAIASLDENVEALVIPNVLLWVREGEGVFVDPLREKARSTSNRVHLGS